MSHFVGNSRGGFCRIEGIMVVTYIMDIWTAVIQHLATHEKYKIDCLALPSFCYVRDGTNEEHSVYLFA